jgi:opacity protein-like surface antigen
LAIATVSFPGTGMAASLEDVIARLDKVEAENAALRERLRRVEGAPSRQAVASKPKQVAATDFQQANARMETKAPAWERPAPPSWTGFYVGANVGGVWGRETGLDSLLEAALGNSSTGQHISGAVGGAQIGANLQYGHIVLGAEVSGDFGRVSGKSLVEGMGSALGGCIKQTATALPLAGAAFKQFSCNAEQDWTVNVLSRFGYSLLDDNLLVYGKGGVSFSHFYFADQLTAFVNGPGNPPLTKTGSASKVLIGGTIGGGVEYRISSPLSVGVEYLYSMYGSQPFAANYFVDAPTQGNQQASAAFVPAYSHHSLDTQMARVFLNYRIGQ